MQTSNNKADKMYVKHSAGFSPSFIFLFSTDPFPIEIS
jgi:hypothetical protein